MEAHLWAGNVPLRPMRRVQEDHQMSNTNTGGPAFPIGSGDMRDPTGMTLRDYFAAKAMQGMYASESFPTGVMADTAAEAYEMADAMLKAREA
jgi:hypothetical protein